MTFSGQERLVDRLLAHVEKNSDDGRLRELAAGLRSGHAAWDESLRASCYAEALQPGLDSFAEWYDQLDDADRAAYVERCILADG